MVTDRSTTMILITYLAYVFPDYLFLFQFLQGLDLSSHYMHMYSSLSGGAASHKIISETGNRFLRLYYSNKVCIVL
jgi:CDP-diacylglycerol--inositol 3-phosphatidyltransferase